MTARRHPRGHPHSPLKHTAQAGRPVFGRLRPTTQRAKNRRDRAPGVVCAATLPEWSGRWHGLPVSPRVAAEERAAFMDNEPEITEGKNE
jgi:hypothetical protein